MKTKTIIVIISLILVLSLIWIFVQGRLAGRIAEIYKNGSLVYSCNLDEITDEFIYKVDGHNSIKLSKDGAQMIFADCPDKICINTGLITGGAYPVVCLPNKVEIRISGGEEDAVSQ